jgi:hypothetical protein
MCAHAQQEGVAAKCVSATASFVAAAVNDGISIACLAKADGRREVPLAAMPVLFSVQKFAEGLLWLTLPVAPDGSDATVLTVAFLLFATVLWPVCSPLAALPGAVAVFAIASSSAMACAPGYKRIKIDSNWVCLLDHGRPTSLASPDGAAASTKASTTRSSRSGVDATLLKQRAAGAFAPAAVQFQKMHFVRAARPAYARHIMQRMPPMPGRRKSALRFCSSDSAP